MAADGEEEARSQGVFSYLARLGLPGLRARVSTVRFTEEVRRSLVKLRAVRGRRFAGVADPKDERFHPYLAAVDFNGRGDREEAIWLTFLSTACGPVDGDDRWRAVRFLYGAAGDGETWIWRRVSGDPRAFREWMVRQRDEVKKLRFGNHRKYETHDPTKRGSTADVVRSYVRWVERDGRGSQAKIFEEALGEGSPEEAFESVYGQIDVERFGRTAKFDWLCLVGNLGIFPIAPGKCYLRGASGPLTGARRLFGGRKGRATIGWLESRAAELARGLRVPVETVEDALCNWQKRPRDRSGGWVSAACAGDAE